MLLELKLYIISINMMIYDMASYKIWLGIYKSLGHTTVIRMAVGSTIHLIYSLYPQHIRFASSAVAVTAHTGFSSI